MRTAEEQIAWDMYFCSLVAFQFHPANADRWKQLELFRFADIADDMMLIRNSRLKES